MPGLSRSDGNSISSNVEQNTLSSDGYLVDYGSIISRARELTLFPYLSLPSHCNSHQRLHVFLAGGTPTSVTRGTTNIARCTE